MVSKEGILAVLVGVWPIVVALYAVMARIVELILMPQAANRPTSLACAFASPLTFQGSLAVSCEPSRYSILTLRQ
jgi:hypothetical protein